MAFITNITQLTGNKTNSKYGVKSFEHSNKGVFVFFVASCFFIVVLIIHLKYNIISNKRNLYIVTNGRLAANFKWNFRFKCLWHFCFTRFFSVKDLDLDYYKERDQNNKLYLTRAAIETEVLTFFNPTPKCMFSSVSRSIELKDYKCKKSVLTNNPLDYVSPRKLVNHFVKFLPRERINHLNRLAKNINADFSKGKQKSEALFSQKIMNLQNELCSICLESVYLPQNVKTGLLEPKYSCVKLPCNHKFHVNCFFKFTFTNKKASNVSKSRTRSSYLSYYKCHSLVNKTDELDSVEEKNIQSKSLKHLRKKLLKQEVNINRLQKNVTTIPFPAKITKSNPKCHIFTIRAEKQDSTTSTISVPLNNKTFYHTNGQLFTDEMELEVNETIRNTLNSRINRKVHCPICDLDIELVLAYIKKMKYKSFNCRII